MKVTKPNKGPPPDALKKYEKAELRSVNSRVLARVVHLSPAEVGRIRAQIARNVSDYLPIIDEVIHGEREFSPTQARLFTALLNKVVPDLSASFVQHEHNATIDLKQMSRAELERIAAGVDAALEDQDDIIDAEVVSSEP